MLALWVCATGLYDFIRAWVRPPLSFLSFSFLSFSNACVYFIASLWMYIYPLNLSLIKTCAYYSEVKPLLYYRSPLLKVSIVRCFTSCISWFFAVINSPSRPIFCTALRPTSFRSYSATSYRPCLDSPLRFFSLSTSTSSAGIEPLSVGQEKLPSFSSSLSLSLSLLFLVAPSVSLSLYFFYKS